MLAARDRVVLGVTVRWGLGPRLAAVQFGDVQFAGPSARLGLRQRFGRGRLALRVDAWGEATTLMGYEGTVADNDVDILPTAVRWTPMVGGQISLGGAAFDMGCSPVGEGCVTSFVLNWPGVVGVF